MINQRKKRTKYIKNTRNIVITIVINQKAGIIYFRFLIIKTILVIIDYRHRDFVFIIILLTIIDKSK